MSIIVIGGGPHPQARIVGVTDIGQLNTTLENWTYEIRDGDEILVKCAKLSHAQALLPLIQLGE